MKTTDPPNSRFPGAEWRSLGELNLPRGSNAAEIINMRLAKILGPLSLPPNFQNKIMTSAQEAVVRLLRLEAVMSLEHTHLIFFVPRAHQLKGQTWGFFRVEKLAYPPEGTTTSVHSVEFYLYMEGALHNLI